MKIKTLALFAVLAGSSLVYADDPNKMKPTDTADKTKSEKLSESDQKEISHQHMVNTMEIDAGQYAQKNGSAQGVKDFAKMVVADHQKLDRELTAFAKQHGMSNIGKKMTMTDEEKKMHDDAMASMNKMKKMKGAELDKSFLQMMVTSHENELARLDGAVANIQNPELKTMLEDTRPILQNHEDKAKELLKQTEQTSSIKGEDSGMSKDKNKNQPVTP